LNNGLFNFAGNFVGRLSGITTAIYARIIPRKTSQNISRAQAVVEVDSKGFENYDFVLGDQRGNGAIRTLAVGEYFPSNRADSISINTQGGPYSVNWATNQPLYNIIQTATASVVLGGRNVQADQTSNYSVVGGDQCNISRNHAVCFNRAGDSNAPYSVFIGNSGSTTGQYSTVLSGGNYPRRTNNIYSVVLCGVRAYSVFNGEVLMGGLTTFAGNHFYFINKNITNDGTTNTFKILMSLVFVGTITRPSYFLKLSISAIQTAGTAGTVGDSASWIIKGGVKFDTTSNAATIGSFVTETRSDAGASAWTANAIVNNSSSIKYLDIEITGEADKTIQWVMCVDGIRLGYT
jgi:hypothetical protein